MHKTKKGDHCLPKINQFCIVMYKQLTSEQRYTISVLLSKGLKKKEIAEAIGVSNSTITRELQRNSSKRGVYKWEIAQKQAEKRSKRTPGNRAISKAIWSSVKHYLVDEQWSPEQISGYLAKDDIKISHETIYAWIREDKRNRGTLYKHLRHRLKHRKKYVGAGRSCIINRKSIHERPAEADGKRFGDLEMDTIVGPNNQQAIVTLVDRNTNMLFMKKLKYGKDAKNLALTVIEMLKPIKKKLKTITTDNGKEFSAHEIISEALGVDVFFTDPYSSWQKGAIENANGLIRQYIPKKVSFNDYDDKDIKDIEEKINRRPRKKLGFETPIERFSKIFL